ncbi:hypothetical protein LIER_05699 [Lithospermum erythrorhizon]|uniref:Uncharacterized protein n=1 Tax=Lithospermum erythrorhizon TaxID=34254 RepID=A0AAV3P443_LITER
MEPSKRTTRRVSPSRKRAKSAGGVKERLKVLVLEQELQGLRLQISNYPWDMALLDQELKRAQAQRDGPEFNTPALVEEYRQWYPSGWLDNTIPLPPLDEILSAPFVGV